MSITWRSFAVLGVLLFGGCKASLKGDAQLQTHADIVETDVPVGPAASTEPDRSGFGDSKLDDADQATLLGARSDVTLTAGKIAANCGSLAVLAASARHPALSWRGPTPSVDTAHQLVLAFTTANGTADAGTAQEMSYGGYGIQGKDVTILLELAQPGHPLTQAAIIPRPSEGGRLRLALLSGRTRRARDPGGEGSPLCEISPDLTAP